MLSPNLICAEGHAVGKIKLQINVDPPLQIAAVALNRAKRYLISVPLLLFIF